MAIERLSRKSSRTKRRSSGGGLDLTTSEGLLRLARATGGRVSSEAEKINNPQGSLLGRLGGAVKGSLMKTLDLLQRSNYAVASAVKNTIDDDPFTTVRGGLSSGFRGQTKHTFSDVFTEAGINPETKSGKVAKGVAGFALDVLLDPTTYITFGTSAGTKVGSKVLTKAGTAYVKEGVEKGLAREFVQKSILEMEQSSPELYKKFVDQGGIKYFGNSIVSGGRVSAVARAIPGSNFIDETTKPTRNALYALFHRDASTKYGKLPREWVEMSQKFRDLGQSRGDDAIDEVVRIAEANKLNYQEVSLINNAIEHRTPLADERLNNARKLIEGVLGRNLAKEQKVGIGVNELPNYVPHILVEPKTKISNFKPDGAKVGLGAAKGRGIKKFISESGEEVIGTAGQFGLKEVGGVRGLAQAITTGEYRSIKDIENALAKYGYKLRFKAQDTVHRNALGYFDPTKKEIVVASGNRSLEDVVSTLKHEMTHSAHFETGGLVEVMETFANRGGARAKSLILAKSAVRNEWEGILKAAGVGDVSEMTPYFRNYYKQPTELLARAVQVMAKNPELAKSSFPKTVESLAGLKKSGELFKALDKKVEGGGFLMGGEVFTDKSGQFFKAQQAAVDEINEAFGKDFFDDNIIRTTAIRSVASARAVTSKEFLKEAAEKFGADAATAPSNYVSVGIKELDGLKFHPAIAESIETFRKGFTNDEATNAMLRAFDKVQNYWKASVTQIFPSFHGRNGLSNVFLNFLDVGFDAINPTKHALAFRLLNMNRVLEGLEKASLSLGGAEAKKVLQEMADTPILTDALGKKWTFGELRKVIKENRIAFGDAFADPSDIIEGIGEKLGKTTRLTTGKRVAQKVNPLSSKNAAFSAGRKVGSTVEEQARLVNFLSNLGKTGDVAQSAGRTKQFLFDYQNLSAFEKNVLRRLVPFYTFTRKNLELQATQLMRQPGKYAGQAKLFSSVSEVISGAELTDEEKKNLPDFLKQGLGLVTRREGDKVELVSTLGTPFEAVFNSLQKNQLLGSISPIVAVPLQLATQRSFFYDRPLDEVDNAAAFKNAPDFIKEYIGFTTRKNKDGSDRFVALNPTRLFILSSLPPTARVQSSIRQLQDENVSGKLKTLQFLAGIRPYSTNTEINEATAEKRKFTELQDLLEDAGTAPTFKRSFVPK
jgi:hypothetical protein